MASIQRDNCENVCPMTYNDEVWSRLRLQYIYRPYRQYSTTVLYATSWLEWDHVTWHDERQDVSRLTWTLRWWQSSEPILRARPGQPLIVFSSVEVDHPWFVTREGTVQLGSGRCSSSMAFKVSNKCVGVVEWQNRNRSR